MLEAEQSALAVATGHGDGDGDSGEGGRGPLINTRQRGGQGRRGREEANGVATSSRGHDEQVDNGQGDSEDEETRDDGRWDEEGGSKGRGSAAVDGGVNDRDGKGATTRTEDEEIGTMQKRG